jgi:hypothetical protein
MYEKSCTENIERDRLIFRIYIILSVDMI